MGNPIMKNIEFYEAQRHTSRWNQEKQKQQQKALKEFMSSKCDLFSSSDWHYYAATTGKSLEWLRDNASYSDPEGPMGTMLNNAIIDDDYDLAELFI
jgi:hypothetical protein